VSVVYDFIFTAFASGVGFVIVKLADAWFNSHVNNASFLDAERNADTREISLLAQQIGEIGTKLWIKNREAPDDLYDEAFVTAKIAELSAAVDLLFSKYPAQRRACMHQVDRLDEAVTSGDFGTSGRKSDHAKVAAVLQSSSAVIQKTKECRRQMPPLWFSRRGS